MKLLHASTIISCLIAVSACTKHEPIPRPVTHVNPAPTERFEITVRISDDAEIPEQLFGRSTYGVENPKRCLPLDYTRALGGVRPELYHEQAQTYEKVGARVFRTYVYEDAIINEDYYGMGVCDWGVQVVTAKMMLGHGSPGMSIGREDVIKSRHVVVYCPDRQGLRLGVGRGCKSERRFPELGVGVQEYFKRVDIKSRRAPL